MQSILFCLQDTSFDVLGITGKTPEILKLSFLLVPPGSWRTRTLFLNHKFLVSGII